MNEFIGSHGVVAVSVLWIVAATAITIAGKLFWSKLTHMEVRQDEMEEDLKNIRANYLNRFESIHGSLNSTKDEILEKIHQLHVLLLELNKPKNNKR